MQAIKTTSTSMQRMVAVLLGFMLLSGVAVANSPQGASVEELQRQQHQQRFKAFKQSRDKAVAEKDMAIRKEAARLIKEKSSQN